MYESGLLILSNHVSYLTREFISTILSDVKKIVSTKLYIHLNNFRQNENGQHQGNHILLKTENSHLLSFLNKFYSEAALQCKDLDVNILLHNVNTKNEIRCHHLNMPVNCLICDYQPSKNCNWLHDMVKSTYEWDNVSYNHLPLTNLNRFEQNSTIIKQQELKSYDSVVLGGTFDHIHVGHKLLISEALLLTNCHLLIGVTADNMLKRKLLSELIQPWKVRAKTLETFISDISSFSPTHSAKQNDRKLEIVQINDPLGPAGTDPNLSCIVVSQETIKGGEAVNKSRISNKLNPLHVHVIGLVQDTETNAIKEDKISSSKLRYASLGTLRVKPTRREGRVKSRYVIGLTGGVASGKSSIAAKLGALGAYVIDCDKLGHQAYLPNTRAFRDIITRFGDDVIADDGTIDRAQLAAKVFGNNDTSKLALNDLNAIVWPEIKRLALQEMTSSGSNDVIVYVVEAAVLLEAGWTDIVDEVWCCVIPPQEAIKRVMKRDGRSEEQAEIRVKSQLSNEQRVAQSNVIFSTLWEHKDTQIQVERAWKDLQKRILDLS